MSAVKIKVLDLLCITEFVIMWFIAEIVSFGIVAGLFVVGTNPNWNKWRQTTLKIIILDSLFVISIEKLSLASLLMLRSSLFLREYWYQNMNL